MRPVSCVQRLNCHHTDASSAVPWWNSFIPQSQTTPFRQQRGFSLLLVPVLCSLAPLPLLLNFPSPTNPRGLAGKPNWFNYIVLIRGSCLRIEGNCTPECTVFSSPNGRLGTWREVEIYPCRLLQPQALGSLKLNWLQGAVFTTLWFCRL
jgi:hypothetical protein